MSDTVEKPRCRLIKATIPIKGHQGFDYKVGISAESVGACAIHLQKLVIPPGARAKAHKHAAHETAIYAISGVSAVWHGPQLEHETTVEPGQFFYIPADTPHLPFNPSDTVPAVVLIARTDPNDQESVELMPELDDLRPVCNKF